MDNRIEIKITKSNDGNVSVEAKTNDDVTNEEVSDLVLGFIDALITASAEEVVHF